MIYHIAVLQYQYVDENVYSPIGVVACQEDNKFVGNRKLPDIVGQLPKIAKIRPCWVAFLQTPLPVVAIKQQAFAAK
jgi:hypothetical protein